MPITPTYPGLYILELPSASHTITAAPTSVAVFVGYTHPFKTQKPLYGTPTPGSSTLLAIPTVIFSFSDYERYFGGFFESDFVSSDLPDAVSQFFLNGGAQAYIVALPVTNYYDVTNVNPPLPFTAAALTVGTITFTALEPTDTNHVMSITIKVSQTDDTVADITASYGLQSQTFRKVSLDPTSANYIEKVVGTPSSFVSSLVTVQPATIGTPYGTFSGSVSRVPMVTSLPSFAATTFQDSDFTQNFQADTPLDKLPIFNLMILPGVADASIWAEAAAFCERNYAFLILDPPANYSVDGMAGLPLIEDFMTSGVVPESRNAAMYFPYLKTTDPITGDPVNRPPGGFVAGIFATTDQTRGVWKAPAGLAATILNTIGVVDTGKMTNGRQGNLNNVGVNAIRQFPSSGTVVFGARTVVTANPSLQQWRYVPVRRMALFIEQTLLANLGWVIFEPNDAPLWIAIRTSIEAFMLDLFRQQAFQGTSPDDAFKVTCDSTTTTPQDQANGVVNIVVAFAPLKPAEFVVIQIAQLAGQTQS